MALPVEGTPRVLVVGAQGALGALVVDAFDRAGWHVLAGGRRPSADPRSRRVDLAEPGTVPAAVAEVDVVVTTVPDAALIVEQTVLDRGGAVVNLSALPASAGRRLQARSTPARGTVVMNAGVAPGVTNLIAADLLARHPEADEIEMVFTISARSTSGRASADFLHRGLTGVAHHRTASVPLPAPFGDRRCLGFAEADAGWLGRLAAGRPVRTYVCFAEAAAHRGMLALNDARVIAGLPRTLLRAAASGGGGEASREPVAHWVGVRRDGALLAARTLEGAGDFRLAAATGVAFAGAVLGDPQAAGVRNPEDVLTLDRIDDTLRAAGARVVDRRPGVAGGIRTSGG